MNSYIYEFKDLPDTSTPLNAETFTAMQNKLLDSIYPIGRGFIDFTNADFSNYLGFTWERTLVGLTPVGLDTSDTDFDTIGKTGGSKYLQEHEHLITNKYGNVNTGDNWAALSNMDNPMAPGTTSIWTAKAGTGDSGNLQPYQVVAYWKRIA